MAAKVFLRVFFKLTLLEKEKTIVIIFSATSGWFFQSGGGQDSTRKSCLDSFLEISILNFLFLS